MATRGIASHDKVVSNLSNSRARRLSMAARCRALVGSTTTVYASNQWLLGKTCWPSCSDQPAHINKAFYSSETNCAASRLQANTYHGTHPVQASTIGAHQAIQTDQYCGHQNLRCSTLRASLCHTARITPQASKDAPAHHDAARSTSRFDEPN